MRGKVTALVTAAVAAAGAASAAIWARGRKGEDAPEPEVRDSTVERPEATEPPAGRAPASDPKVGEVDDLTAIKGLGKVKVAKLVAAGVTSYAQIAAWNDDDIAEYGLQTNTSPGQIKREDWVGQAKALSEGRGSGPA